MKLLGEYGKTSSGSVRNSAGCRYSSSISLYSAHTGTIEGPVPYVHGLHVCLCLVCHDCFVSVFLSVLPAEHRPLASFKVELRIATVAASHPSLGGVVSTNVSVFFCPCLCLYVSA